MKILNGSESSTKILGSIQIVTPQYKLRTNECEQHLDKTSKPDLGSILNNVFT